jgi:integrase
MTKKIGIYKDPRKKKPWVARWFGLPEPVTGKKRRYSKSFEYKSEAEDFQAKQLLAFKAGEQRDKAEEKTLNDLCKGWMKAKRQCTAKTVEGCEAINNRLLDYFGPDVELGKLSAHSADTFMAELKPLQGDKLSGWTVRKILGGCKAMFNKAVKWGWITGNPFDDVEAPKGLSIRAWHYLTPAEYHKLLDASPSLKWQALYALAYTAGLRKGELFNLRWADIDFQKHELTVQNHAATKETPLFRAKNGKPRTIPLPTSTVEIIHQLQLQARLRTPYILLTERQYLNVVDRWQKYREQKRPWKNDYMENNTLANFKRHVKAAGIEPNGVLCLHTLRKCAGKNWADNIKNPKTVQTLMGHASLSTTMEFYNQVSKDDKQKAADAIDGLLAKTDAKVTPAANLGA